MISIGTRSSPALNAWTLQIYVRYEAAIADLLAAAVHRPAVRWSPTTVTRRAGNGLRPDRARWLAGARRVAAAAGARGPGVRSRW